jgi:hypothetical protein
VLHVERKQKKLGAENMKWEDANYIFGIYDTIERQLMDQYKTENYDLYLNIFLEDGRVLKTGEFYTKENTKLVVDSFNNQYIDSQKIVSIEIVKDVKV